MSAYGGRTVDATLKSSVDPTLTYKYMEGSHRGSTLNRERTT